MKERARYYISKLGLSQHVEGGAFKEHYRSPLSLPQATLGAAWQGDCSASTAIYFLLQHGEFSAFHRLASDEMLHFYDGGPLTIYRIDPDGTLHTEQLGRDLEAGEQFTRLMPAGHWFAMRCEVPGSFSLIGCTVAPGFDFADFVMGDKATLASCFPAYRELIETLCLG